MSKPKPKPDAVVSIMAAVSMSRANTILFDVHLSGGCFAVYIPLDLAKNAIEQLQRAVDSLTERQKP